MSYDSIKVNHSTDIRDLNDWHLRICYRFMLRYGGSYEVT